MSIQWRPQFTLPVEKKLDSELHETVYSVEYQDILIIVLNSTGHLEKQTEYNVKEKLSKTKAKWKIVTNHHSVFSPASGRDFKYARKIWKPLFDKYGVDLVLNGHDHMQEVTYLLNRHQLIYQEILKHYMSLLLAVLNNINSIKNKLSYQADGYKSDKLGQQIQFFQVISIKNKN